MVREDPSIVSPSLAGVFIGGVITNTVQTGSRCTLQRLVCCIGLLTKSYLICSGFTREYLSQRIHVPLPFSHTYLEHAHHFRYLYTGAASGRTRMREPA